MSLIKQAWSSKCCGGIVENSNRWRILDLALVSTIDLFIRNVNEPMVS